MSLDKIISAQKSSCDKGGVGFEEGQCSKPENEEQQKGNADFSKDSHSKFSNNTFRGPPNSRQDHMTRFNNSFFYGYCFSCNRFGHKAANCRVYARNDFKYVNRNYLAPWMNYNVICYKCNNFGHTARVYRSGVADFSKQNKKVDKAKEVHKKVWRKKKEVEKEKSGVTSLHP